MLLVLLFAKYRTIKFLPLSIPKEYSKSGSGPKKNNVVGSDAHPLFKWLDNNYKVKPKWNFFKFVINKEGLIIVDNVLWHGEVVDKTKNDRLTNIIRDFNSYVKDDKKTEQIILPLGDGFTVCRKL